VLLISFAPSGKENKRGRRGEETYIKRGYKIFTNDYIYCGDEIKKGVLKLLLNYAAPAWCCEYRIHINKQLQYKELGIRANSAISWKVASLNLE
jgi:hypothetical protein